MKITAKEARSMAESKGLDDLFDSIINSIIISSGNGCLGVRYNLPEYRSDSNLRIIAERLRLLGYHVEVNSTILYIDW